MSEITISGHKAVGHWYKATPNHGGDITGKLRFIVIHYTAGGRGSADFLCDPRRTKNSAHVVIERDGTIRQIVPFNLKAFHAGQSSWRGVTGLNSYAIGIELENFGPVKLGTDGVLRTYAGNGRIDASDVIAARHKNPKVTWDHWQVYPQAQLEACAALCRALVSAYPQIEEFVGHDDIAPNRKQDPGPAFPWDWFRAAVPLAPAEAYETLTILNVRSGPSAGSTPVQGSPFAPGVRVQMAEIRGDWAYVQSDSGVTGWVAKRYLRPVA